MSNSRETNTHTPSADYIEPTQVGDQCIFPLDYEFVFLKLLKSTLQIKLFMLIYAKYQSVSYKKKAVCPFYASYADFAKAVKYNNTKSIKNGIKALIETGIIQRTTGRKGRAKYGYIVNNQLLNDMAKKYTE